MRFRSLGRQEQPMMQKTHIIAIHCTPRTILESLGLTPFERYEVGGEGFQQTRFLGRDPIGLRGYNVITPSGGAPIFNKFIMEMRYPISLNPSATVYTLAFLEGGNFWNSIQDYQPFNLKRSFGVGLRVFLPMFGLLGFDYGIGFDDDDLDAYGEDGGMSAATLVARGCVYRKLRCKRPPSWRSL